MTLLKRLGTALLAILWSGAILAAEVSFDLKKRACSRKRRRLPARYYHLS